MNSIITSNGNRPNGQPAGPKREKTYKNIYGTNIVFKFVCIGDLRLLRYKSYTRHYYDTILHRN